MESASAQRVMQAVQASLAHLPAPLFLGLSGGMDSMLLMEALTRLQVSFTALHVHHGLQAAADDWARFCQRQAAQRALPFVCERVTVASGASLEACARKARYQAFASRVGMGTLLLAQHQDDQAETLLLRLARGSGALGLGGMVSKRRQGGMTLARPLLGISRAVLVTVAKEWQIDWVEDPSNSDERFKRNWLRQTLLPLWHQQDAGVSAGLARSASLLAETATLLDELAELDLRPLARDTQRLPVAELSRLSVPRRNNLLRFWLADKEMHRPGADWLARLQREVLAAGADRLPQLALEKGVLTRFRDHLYWVPNVFFAAPPEARRWSLAEPLQLGCLHLERVDAATAVPDERVTDTSGYLHLPTVINTVEVRFAQGGERLLRHGQHQQVSECWRAAGVPPWVRRWLPLLYVDGVLVAVAGVGTADSEPDTSMQTARVPARLVQTLHWRLLPEARNG